MAKALSPLRILALLIIILLVVSCGSAQVTTTTTPIPTTTTPTPTTTITTPTTTTTTTTITTPPITTTPTTTTTTSTTTWDELAIRGANTFSSICASCHGSEGGGDYGPAIIGTSLRGFGTAQRLFDYISTQMPQDGPGSLSGASYLRILAFMLTESGFVQPEDIFDAGNLANVLLN